MTPQDSAPSRRLLVSGLIAVTVLAGALRLPFLAHQSLWFDEIYTRAILGRHGLTSIWDQIRRTESTPPLYYLLAKLSTVLAGTRSAAAMRLPSALALTAATPVSYFAFRRLIGEPAALGTAAFLAVNPLLVSYATDARSYGVFVLTALLSVWGFAAALQTGDRRSYAGWALASIACLWSHYFGAFTVAGEAAILLVAAPDRRRVTAAWTLLIVVCAAPLVPLLVHQNDSEDSAFIAGISFATRLEQTIRQFGMGPNVPRAWLEALGLVVIYVGLVAGAAVSVGRSGARIVLALGLITVGLPLAVGVVGIEDRFYVRNVIVGVPFLGALASIALVRLRAVPLAAYGVLALAASLWVATSWPYEVADWRTAITDAAPLDHSVPVVTYGFDSERVAATYLGRGPAGGPVRTTRVVLMVEPYRGPGDRGFVPQPIPAALADSLGAFHATDRRIVQGFQIVTLQTTTPTVLAPPRVPDTALFGG